MLFCADADGNGVGAVCSVATTLLLYTGTSSWAEGRLPSSIRAAWWGGCVLVGSAPVLVSAWATHLCLRGVVDPLAGLIFGVVGAILVLALPILVVPGVLFLMFKSRAGLCRTLVAVWAAVRCVGSYTVQVRDVGLANGLGVLCCHCCRGLLVWHVTRGAASTSGAGAAGCWVEDLGFPFDSGAGVADSVCGGQHRRVVARTRAPAGIVAACCNRVHGCLHAAAAASRGLPDLAMRS